jgi:flavin-binding protein dodecin
MGPRARHRAVRALESILADAERLTDVTADQIRELCEGFGVDIRDRLRAPCRNLYRRYLEHCLVDCSLSEEESQDLSHLKDILCIEDPDAGQIHDDVARSVYGAAVEEVLRDYKLDEEEERFLTELCAELQLADAEAERLYQEEAQRAQQRFLSKHTAGHGALTAQTGRVDLQGSSTEGLEDAIREALERAREVLPQLESAELGDVSVRVENGRITRWDVILQGSLGRPPS